MVRRLTLAFAVLFAFVVASGYVPGFYTVEGGERVQWGLFRLTLLDDITHGVTALAALLAGATSRKLSLLFLTAFGFYYALDAVFFLTYGLFNEKPWIDDVLLNLPHVLISAAMLWIVYRVAPVRD